MIRHGIHHRELIKSSCLKIVNDDTEFESFLILYGLPIITNQNALLKIYVSNVRGNTHRL